MVASEGVVEPPPPPVPVPTVTTRARWTLPIFASVMVLGTTVVAVGVLWFVWPSGKKVGEIDLQKGGSVMVQTKAGDTLHFGADESIELAGNADSDEDRGYERLSDSTITVTVELPGTAPISATCPAYSGKAMSSSTGMGKLSLSGVVLSCLIAVPRAGEWKVSASVQWASRTWVRSAKLHVRLASHGR